MDTNFERIEKIDKELKILETRKLELEKERQNILNKMNIDNYNSILECIPVRTRNALKICGIDTLSKLISYMHGDCSAISPNCYSFRRIIYNRAKNEVDRLKALTNVGNASAISTVIILKHKGIL